MPITIFIPGRMPGFNDLINMAKSGRGKFNAYGRTKNQWTAYIAGIVKECNLDPIEKAVVRVRCLEPNRRRDQDNVTSGAKKLCFDGLVKAGLFKDDGWRHIELGKDSVDIDKFSPGVEIIIDKGGHNEDL